MVHAAVVVALLAALTAMWTPAASGQAGPQITVSQTSGLVDGQIVTIQGTGFAPGELVNSGMCQTGNDVIFTCDLATINRGQQADSNGAVTLTHKVHRDVISCCNQTSTWVDCETTTCFIRAGMAVAPVTFATSVPPRPAPSLTVTGPLNYLRFEAEGLPPNRNMDTRIRVCRNDDGCAAPVRQWDVATSATGTIDLSASMPDSWSPEAATYACRIAPGCTAQAIVQHSVVAAAPLAFSVPELTVAIGALATSGPGPTNAVGRATISCDVATPVSVIGSITQGGLTGSHTYSTGANGTRWCRPDAPFDAFLPAVDIAGAGAFGPGTASVSVEAVPWVGPGVESVTATATVQMIDEATVREAIDVALQDPANVALRTTIVEAIARRLWQDPLFLAYWISLFTPP